MSTNPINSIKDNKNIQNIQNNYSNTYQDLDDYFLQIFDQINTIYNDISKSY